MSVKNKARMDKRLDIQALRGIAVLVVILYHFDIPPFSGGFVGVDIFFVISGYLMTGIILSQAANEDDGQVGFSYSTFFMRRLRRLFPMLLATTAAVFLCGVVLFAAFDMERLAIVSMLAPLGLSNIFFWAEAGYFDVEAIRKPLLHTWSLAVEIQFYLIWPAIVLLGAKAGRRALVWLIICLAVLSFSGGLAAMRIDPVAAFYMMPLRGYEFCFGGLAYLGQAKLPRAALLKHLLYFSALVALFVAFVFYDKLTTFPGLTPLPVVTATALLLWIGDKSFLSKLTSNKPLQTVGDMSYAAYLVHWPVVVFSHYLLQRTPSATETVGLLVLVAAGTVALYHGVEQPLRNSSNRVWTSWRRSLAVLALIFILPLSAWMSGGWPARGASALYSLNTLDKSEMAKTLWPYFEDLQQRQEYTTEKPNLLIIGDSQAADYVNVLRALDAEKYVDIITRVVFTTCNIPYLDDTDLQWFLKEANPYSMKDPNLLETCPRLMEAAVGGAAWANADAVVLAFAWRDVSMPVMPLSFAQLAARTDASIYAVGNKTLQSSPIELANRLGTTEGLGDYAYNHIRSWTPLTNAIIAQEKTVHLIDILSLFCQKGDCRVLDDEGRPLLWDETHLSRWGNRFVAEKGGPETLMPFVVQE